MADLDRLATQFSDGLRFTLGRLASLAFAVAAIGATVGAATYITGLLSLDGSSRSRWTVFGLVLCLIPAIAGFYAWFLVRRTARYAPQVVGEVRSLLGESKENVAMVIDHDTGQPLVTTTRSMVQLRSALGDSATARPALSGTVHAVAKVPALAALTVVSTLLIGLFGTILLIVGILDAL